MSTRDNPLPEDLAKVPSSVKEPEYILIDDDLALALDGIARTKMLGQTRSDVAMFIMRDYMWKQDGALCAIGACPSAVKCKHRD
jgi:hypothetical protein